MVDARRVQLRKPNPYNTKSNKRRVIKTPGWSILAQRRLLTSANRWTIALLAHPQKANRSKVPALRPRGYATISKRQKSVTRAYGGSRCAHCVRERIVRAFLVEEAKIVKKVIKSQTAK
ncbi:hypothetical protein E3P81_03698 [Wallemia ichthyophaga]|nr:hypothetical protein E3P97_03706 [Wallemia ichthyophaga]TIB28621.1 hypothetical protein E3P85_03572 [Wallemia ichthyophaga]TIB44139.1 hypothetical protein E3P82_03703 [Wallemia ichthyophaga]TIB46344.1 hypothetical protein E3P81_03698 [Wallemia ichthyophaga]TIB48916.1 hypothetical protein E3P80_03707 [Wallemia ichthyophaga]